MAEESKPKLDSFTSKIVGDPAKPQDTLLVTGFLGASSEHGHTRIYTDPTLDTYVDVANSDIVHSEPLAKEQSPLGGHYIWVKKNAEILSGQAGTARTKAKFLEGPIAAQAAGAPAHFGPPFTVPFFVCHPTVVVQLCRTQLPAHCPSHAPIFCPSPIPILCGQSPLPAFCPPTPVHHCFTPLCPTLPQVCIPHVTVNQPHCVASPNCPPPPVGGPVEAQAGFAQAPVAQFPHSIFCPSVFIQCPPPTFLHHCPSVPAFHCPSAPPICLHTVFIACHTLQPQCFPVASPNCPPATGDCPFGGLPGGGVINPQFGAFAAQAALPQTQLPALCVSVPCPSLQAALCPSLQAALCPTPHCTVAPQCVTQHCTVPPQCITPHCTVPPQCPPPTVPPQCPVTLPPHCPPPTPLCPTPGCPTPHCPTPHCPTPHCTPLCPSVHPLHCPSEACTEVGPHCVPTPNVIHCPTPNQLCPQTRTGPQCQSAFEVCPTLSQILCFAASPNCPPPAPGGPVEFQAQAAQAAQGIHVQPSVFAACFPTAACPVVTRHPIQCSAVCPPRTFSFVQCFVFTPNCPILSAFCPPPQSIACPSIACGPGGFGGFNPGF
jgi:hypothetical protein